MWWGRRIDWCLAILVSAQHHSAVEIGLGTWDLDDPQPCDAAHQRCLQLVLCAGACLACRALGDILAGRRPSSFKAGDAVSL